MVKNNLIKTCTVLNFELITSVEAEFLNLDEHKVCADFCPPAWYEIRYTIFPYTNNYNYELGKVNIA